MIARNMDSLCSWLKKVAKLSLAFLKEYGPPEWKESLDSLQQLDAGPMLEAGNEMLKSLTNTGALVLLVLVVYLLATSELVGVLVMAIVGLGLFLVLNKLNSNECQEA